MSERISLAAVMILTHFGRIEAAFIPCLLQCKGLVLALKSCSLLPKHPHPKCGVRATSTQDIPHLMAKSSWFCSWRALLHPYGVSMVPSSLRGARGTPQWGEVQTLPGEQGLAQGTHLEWHHLPRAGLGCALSQPRAWDRSNPCIQPHDVLRESNIQGLQGSNHCWLHSAPLLPEASKGFGPCSLRSCCTALGRAEQQLLCRASTATHWCHFLGTNVPSLDRNRS